MVGAQLDGRRCREEEAPSQACEPGEAEASSLGWRLDSGRMELVQRPLPGPLTLIAVTPRLLCWPHQEYMVTHPTASPLARPLLRLSRLGQGLLSWQPVLSCGPPC